ncbi:MAG: ABC transporter permease [Candidatus Poseidoniales archaeon]|jgi:ABC-type dipeptide/oligopeptide/nickel transport system permease subunit
MSDFKIDFIIYSIFLIFIFLIFGIISDMLRGHKWSNSLEDRNESLNRFIQGWRQRIYDIRKSWKIFRKSVLAIIGLTLIVTVSTISIFADDIAVEHPYRNLQDTEDLWWIDNEPRREAPFSEACDWHEQGIDMFGIKTKGYSRYVTAVSDPVFDENGSLNPRPLIIIEIESMEDDLGYELNNSLIVMHNETTFFVTDDALNASSSKIWVTFEFQNDEMHHWWLPDGHDVCIMGTTNTGQDLFSKILYGSRISLKIGITVAFLTVALGTMIGSISGYYGGIIDEVIMRITDVFFAVPGLILAMAFVAALQNTTSLTMPMFSVVVLLLFFVFLSTRNVISELITGEGTDQNTIFKIKGKLKEISNLGEGGNPLGISILKTSLFLLRYRGFFSIILAMFALTFWSNFWPNNSGMELEKSLMLVAIFILCLMVMILDQNLNQGVPRKLISERVSGLFDFGNPYRFLALRTILIFISVVLLIFVTKSNESNFVVIKDFDRLWKIQAALILTGWPGYARLIRGQVLYIREMTFVEAAKSVGAPDGRIMFRHILPSAWAPLLVAFTLDVGGTILSASGLSFIGLGAEPGTAEWGILVSDGRRFFPNSWWLVTFPGLAILFTTLGFNLLGDGLRDIVDPKNKR